MGDASIVCSRAKIEATIGNARAFLDMADRGESFSAWAWSFVDGVPLTGDGHRVDASTPRSATLSTALKTRGFKFVGPTIVHAWMQAAGMVNDHAMNCFRRDQV